MLASTSFPAHFSTKVSVKKVNLQVLRPWISQKLESLLGFEDEVVIEYVYSLLEEQGPLDPRRMQIKLTGFLESKTPGFMSELWALMVSAQESLGGIPKAFLEQKKAEILAKKVLSNVHSFDSSNAL